MLQVLNPRNVERPYRLHAGVTLAVMAIIIATFFGISVFRIIHRGLKVIDSSQPWHEYFPAVYLCHYPPIQWQFYDIAETSTTYEDWTVTTQNHLYATNKSRDCLVFTPNFGRLVFKWDRHDSFKVRLAGSYLDPKTYHNKSKAIFVFLFEYRKRFEEFFDRRDWCEEDPGTDSEACPAPTRVGFLHPSQDRTTQEGSVITLRTEAIQSAGRKPRISFGPSYASYTTWWDVEPTQRIHAVNQSSMIEPNNETLWVVWCSLEIISWAGMVPMTHVYTKIPAYIEAGQLLGVSGGIVSAVAAIYGFVFVRKYPRSNVAATYDLRTLRGCEDSRADVVVSSSQENFGRVLHVRTGRSFDAEHGSSSHTLATSAAASSPYDVALPPSASSTALADTENKVTQTAEHGSSSHILATLTAISSGDVELPPVAGFALLDMQSNVTQS